MTPDSHTTTAPNLLTRTFDALTEWGRTDGRTWVYLFKALLACFLALGVALKLQLPQPRTAMTTVFIVMQPQSGMVLAKSFYRVCGTLVGLVMTLTLVGLFPQQPELFVVATAIWVGICTAGAARNRNFQSYGFVLAGYTAALIGFPGAQNPDGAFMAALTRAAEVVIGILCSGLVSAIVLPQHATEQMRGAVRARFSAFVNHISASLSGKTDRDRIEETTSKFVADVIGLESMRSVAVFEGPEARMRSGRLSRLNTEFMAVSTRLHSLHQLMNRMRSAGEIAVVAALEPYFHEVSRLLADEASPVLMAADAQRAAARLEDYRSSLESRLSASRLAYSEEDRSSLMDFDTGAELLVNFVDDLLAYVATYASLAVASHEREHWAERYEPKTNSIAAAISGFRATLVTVVLGAFWIATAWPSGATLALNAAAVCALASSSPVPARTAYQMSCGTLLGATLAGVIVFGVYPKIDGFPLLCAALTPFLAFGIWLTTRRKTVGYGVGYCLYFCFLAGPDNVVQYDPTSLINNGIALAISALVTSIAFAVVLPPSSPWLRRHLFKDLRRQVVLASRGPVGRLWRLRSRFESGTRDLMYQISALAGGDPSVKRETTQWMFSVLEVGNAVIDLRREIAGFPGPKRFQRGPFWRDVVHGTCKSLESLYATPSSSSLRQALLLTANAITVVREHLQNPAIESNEERQMQRMLSYLHFIRSALLDPQSPLRKFDDDGARRGDLVSGVKNGT